jgi:hypothetical protein
VQPAEPIIEHAGLQQALQAVVDACEHAVAHEGEDDRVGMQGAQATETEPLLLVHPRERPYQPVVPGIGRGALCDQFHGHDQAYEHTYDAKNDRGHDEGLDDPVVVLETFDHRVKRWGSE